MEIFLISKDNKMISVWKGSVQAKEKLKFKEKKSRTEKYTR